MAERYKEEILSEIPEVDAIVGTTSYKEIVDVVKEAIKGKKVQKFSDINIRLNEQYERILTTAGYYGYLKISEGCNNACTYCVIPKIREHIEAVL